MPLTPEMQAHLRVLLEHAQESAIRAHDALHPPGGIGDQSQMQFTDTDQRIWYANSQALVASALADVVEAIIEAEASGIEPPIATNQPQG